MSNVELLNASTRVALAAYLHDLGKFAERAGIEEAEQKDSDGNSIKELNKQQYCPNFSGRYSHVHAAYTAIAMDVIEKHLPDIKKSDCSPFASWSAGNMDEKNDSLINAAARHHKPETFLQWVIATADRLSSGFERTQFDEYNQAEDIVQDGNKERSYKTARMEVLLEKISLSEKSKVSAHRYTLSPLSPAALFPQEKNSLEPQSDKEGTKQYHDLWNGFIEALKRENGEDAIPASHKQNLALWLDHFDSLWLTFTHCIPSATASKVGNKFIQIPADVSLYDHAKSTAALATALWRWHQENNACGEDSVKKLKYAEDYSEEKFLLVQGDMFGIQDFIFQSGGSSSKFASKLLRGRSFYVSLLSECAALRVLDALALPSTSQVINAAGKFLIVAPNTKSVIEKLTSLREEFNRWSLNNTQGRSGLGLAWSAACANDFINNKNESAFKKLLNALFDDLDKQKHQRLNLWSANTPKIFSGYLDSFNKDLGVCDIDGISPAVKKRDGVAIGQMALDQIDIGTHLAKSKRLIVSREKLNNSNSLGGDILGFYIHFTKSEEESGRFAAEVKNNNLLRCWDFSFPDADANKPLWNGYARRNINGYVARFALEDLHAADGKYKQFEGELDCIEDFNEIKTFNHLACENRIALNKQGEVISDPTQAERWTGIAGLHALKGDVDNLGLIFQKGYENPNFAKMAALSRQVNSFFAIVLPWLCQQKEYQQTYTVFAGGDDFFLIGAWKTQMALANKMHQEFARYVANNNEIHFSAGLHLTKPGLPIRSMSVGAEDALDGAKSIADKTKNAVTCFGQTMHWDKFNNLLQETEWLESVKQKHQLSTGYVYGLLELADMADASNKNKPEKSIWRSQLSYRTFRTLTDKKSESSDETFEERCERVKAESNDLLCKLADKFTAHGKGYHVPLYVHLYTNRD